MLLPDSCPPLRTHPTKFLGWIFAGLMSSLPLSMAEDPLEAALKRAEQIASAGPIAVQTCMRSLRKQMSRGLEDSLWREADEQAQ